MRRQYTVFFISDGTGITAEALGHSLLSLFEHIEVNPVTKPYIDTAAKAEQVVVKINAASHEHPPLVFMTLVDPQLRAIIQKSRAVVLDFLSPFLGAIEQALGVQATSHVGKAHGLSADNSSYNQRIAAINFALSCDDGANTHHYQQADVIVIGVSRSAKTPTCLYLAMQYGIFAANHPFTDDDLHAPQLPLFLQAYRAKLFGLLIEANRLQTIRSERRPGSRYASLSQCQQEARAMQALYQRERIPCVNTSTRSIEEIATTIITALDLTRRVF